MIFNETNKLYKAKKSIVMNTTYIANTRRVNSVKMWSVGIKAAEQNAASKWTNEAVERVGMHVHSNTVS